jgi:tetratricopeptide (TPR) repeat protein
MDLEELLSNVRILEEKGQVDGPTYKKLGIKFFSERNYGLAKEFFEKSYKVSNDLTSLCNLGVVIGKYFGDYNEANKIFQNVISQDKTLPLAYYNLACNEVRMKKPSEAIGHLKIALELGKEEYVKIAQSDPAFETIEAEPAFKQIVPGYKSSSEHTDI